MREKIMMPLYDYMACMDYMNPPSAVFQTKKIS